MADVQEQEGTVLASNGGEAPEGEALAHGRVVDDYVPAPPPESATAAMSERALSETIHVLRLACATNRAPMIAVALATVELLVARGFIRGEVTSLMLDGEGRSGAEASLNARGLSEYPERLPVVAQPLHLVCGCEDFGQEEDIEVCPRASVSIQ